MSMTRTSSHGPFDGRSHQPLLDDEQQGRMSTGGFGYGDVEGRPMLHHSRRSTMRSKSPDALAKQQTRQKYFIASGFLLLSLASFVVQTETAVYIQHDLGWDKPYCMLYLTHGSWFLLWPVQLLILRLQKRKLLWEAFWRRHLYLLRTTGRMVETQDLHPTSDTRRSPVPYLLKTTAFVTSALTVAGGSWYVAVNLTTPSDLTAIYNCSAFFAYAFSIPLLKEKLRLDKVFSVGVAIVGVLIVAYGGKDDGKGIDGEVKHEGGSRLLGNVIIGIGSVLYGLYEVLYKRFACPPEGTSAGRSMIFANTFGSLIGSFTLLVLWIPLPVFHILGIETFRWPTGEAAWMLLISVIANASEFPPLYTGALARQPPSKEVYISPYAFSGSFLVLISLTSPVLSSVASLLTIFLVAIVDWFRTGQPLSMASIIGGILIMIAFFLLSWSTYREMNEERKQKIQEDDVVSESDE
ncbi:DMT family transporter [Aspergillus foveolatus]|uniref:DMT family transporter n=1 Tax=Aspergillus foveolatus TaxID=210207 RepID=UPI003CCCC2E3